MSFENETFDFNALSDSEIELTLQDNSIPLKVEEARKIQNELLGRAPSLSELILFSIQGSEHSSYKSSRSHLKQFTTTGPDVVLGAKEDAGVVAVATDSKGHRWCVVMSHESHNHPSQIVPYEGAATGVGGNVRDVMCMGAEVLPAPIRSVSEKLPATKPNGSMMAWWQALPVTGTHWAFPTSAVTFIIMKAITKIAWSRW